MGKLRIAGEGERWIVYHADVMDYLEGTAWLRGYDGFDGGLFHAALFDPPYHLSPIVQRFGKPGSAPAKGDVYARSSAGFMGQKWDGGDLVFRPELWAALAQHLYPGAFGMAFASSRGWHRMAMAIEDAGLIIHPSIFGWNYLSGFPKATRIDTQVDRAAGIEISRGKGRVAFAPRKVGYRAEEFSTNGYQDGAKHSAQSPLAQQWAGHRYGLQALKPALEPIIVFQRPYEGRPVDCIVRTGTGALNINGGRIEAEKPTGWAGQPSRGYNGFDYDNTPRPVNGRWPANFTMTHSPDCNGDCVPDCPVRLLDEQAGNRPAGSSSTGDEPSEPSKNVYGKRNPVAFAGYEDSGPASRMFHCSDWAYEVAEQLAQADPVRYEPKASSAEREAGLSSLPTQIRHRVNAGGLENEPRFAPTQVKNMHPTVKPLSLLMYLSRLLAPPAAYTPRRLLVPFAGSGSEVCGAILSGYWEEVVGIEKEEGYINVAKARIDFWDSVADRVRVYGLDTVLQKHRKQKRPSDGQPLLFEL